MWQGQGTRTREEGQQLYKNIIIGIEVESGIYHKEIIIIISFY